MRLNAGWLAKDPTFNLPSRVLYEVVIPRASAGTTHDPKGAVFPTRIEEYSWLVGQLEPEMRGATILSAGAGYNSEIHVLEYCLANMGHHVMAVDANPAGLDMPKHVNVQRFLGDITNLPFPDASYDIWVCVSVLEHMSDGDRAKTFGEAFRLLRSRGLVLLTTDETPPPVVNGWLKSAGFLVGATAPFAGTMLQPAVTYATARKP